MLEGKLRILLHCNAAQVNSVEIRSSRPQISGRLLEGNGVAQALSKVPVIYSICRQAQSLAATLAAEAAGSDTTLAGLPLGARLEALQEHLWRFFIDLPGQLGEKPLLKEFAPIRQQIVQQVKLLDSGAPYDDEDDLLGRLSPEIESMVWGGSSVEWSGQGEADLQAWLESGASSVGKLLWRASQLLERSYTGYRVTCDQGLLGTDSLVDVVQALGRDDQFSAQPWLQQGHPEAGAMARHQEHPLVTALVAREQRAMARFVARLLEIDRLLNPAQAIGMGRISLGDGSGAGWVETARGILVHRLDIHHGRVQRYQVVAPTEWNFHPEGPLVREVLALAGDNVDLLRQRVQLICLSLDPCVSFEIEVYNA
ncbi:nickel-dependent hydrogenase large subunit [Aestuariirhabdus sp. LZHN29]|uniref:nickel-dependent hydrogenase large subunit n=1 Tax=Aestuariirhabdus sp. LZHN29 TaxID=3417462 RepID=UPI003CF4AB41